MTTQPVAPTSIRPARFDLFGPIHKAIRFALSDLMIRMGTADFADEATAAAIVADLELVVALCEDHLLAEETTLLPALYGRLTGELESIRAAHDEQTRLVAELRALAASLVKADAGMRPFVGRTLYLHFSTYAAENVLHMAEEEQVVQPLFDRLLSDAEVRALHRSAMAKLTPEAHGRGAPYILRATTRVERAALVSNAIATMPSEVVRALVDIVRAKLPPDELADLVARTGLSV